MYSDQQIRDIVDQLFRKYDKDYSNSLDSSELAPFLNEVFVKVNYPMYLSSKAQAIELLRYLDVNHDGTLSKQEMFNVVKYLVNSASQMNNPQPTYQQKLYQEQQIQNPYLYDRPNNPGNLSIHQQPKNPYGYLETDNIPPYLYGKQQGNIQQPQRNNQFGGNNPPNMPNSDNISTHMVQSFCWQTLMNSQKKPI